MVFVTRLFLSLCLIVSLLSLVNGYAIRTKFLKHNSHGAILHSKRHMSTNEQNKIEIITVEEVEEEEVAPVVEVAIPDDESEEDKYKRTKLAEIAEKKALEVFVTQETGKYECQACGFIYDEAKGYEKKGIAEGTKFEDIEKFRCPECGANKKYFIAETETISGFKENLNYGFGTNKMTGAMKTNLIFGGLGLGFVLFMVKRPTVYLTI